MSAACGNDRQGREERVDRGMKRSAVMNIIGLVTAYNAARLNIIGGGTSRSGYFCVPTSQPILLLAKNTDEPCRTTGK